MTVVSNAGPLIALAKIDHLPLLKTLFGQVLIPPLVHPCTSTFLSHVSHPLDGNPSGDAH